MATVHYCDHMSHDAEGGKFTAAVVHIDFVKKDVKSSNTIHRHAYADACMEHIGELTEGTYRLHHKDPLFVQVEVRPYTKKDDDG
jgi:hypothetical protein